MSDKNTFKAGWGSYKASIEDWAARAAKNGVVSRLWKKDPTLWKKEAAAHADIKSRLGWLTVLPSTRSQTGAIKTFAAEVKAEGIQHVVLLGMGGSSLCPELFQSVFGNAAGHPELLVLDSTDPAGVLAIENKIDLDKTLFIVSSKSGGTIELLSFLKYFHDKLKRMKGDAAGHHFVAITDPGTPLVALAKANGFRKTFLAPEDVGGRFSALTAFGILPAALIGVDVDALLVAAEKMASEAAIESISENTSVLLGIALTVLAEEGRDKLTIVTSPKFAAFGDWAEQLVAESTGKEDVGIIPVVGETLGNPDVYGSDRFFVAVLSAEEDNSGLEKKLAALEAAGHPVLTLKMGGAIEIGAEFFRWEVATAVACSLLKINAFDQPDVQAAKDKARAILKSVEEGKALEPRMNDVTLESFWENADTGNYVSILAFVPPTEPFKKRLRKLATETRNTTRLAVTLGLGPRYLHSTGQLHKGGPNTGLFILITTAPDKDVAVPAEKYSFGTLELAQAMGDYEALETRGRWMIHLRLDSANEAALDQVCARIESAAKTGAVAG